MKTEWKFHYTGNETRELKGFFTLYMSRHQGKKWPRLVRLSRGKFMLGAFMGKTLNRCKWSSGIEIFTNRFMLGIARPKFSANRRIYWQGSMSEPFTFCVLRIGWVWVGFSAPGWLEKYKERKLYQQTEEWYQ